MFSKEKRYLKIMKWSILCISGHARLVGIQTGKILDFDVRNKNAVYASTTMEGMKLSLTTVVTQTGEVILSFCRCNYTAMCIIN